MSEPAGAGRRILHLTDVVVAAILLAGSAYCWRLADNFEQVPDLFAQNLAPDVFPKLLLACIAGLSLTLPFEHLFLAGGRERLDGGRKENVKARTYIVGGMVVLLLAAMPYLGTILSLFAISLVMPFLWGERRLTRVLPFAVLFPSAVVLVFGFLLEVHLDPGVYGVGLY